MPGLPWQKSETTDTDLMAVCPQLCLVFKSIAVLLDKQTPYQRYFTSQVLQRSEIWWEFPAGREP